jgi:endonuclease YncB( thermonuclease family)
LRSPELFAEVGGGSLDAEFLENYDGDTLTVNLPSLRAEDDDGSEEVFWKEISVRIVGIDAPEMKAECKAEEKKAIKAKELVEKTLKKAKLVVLGNVSRDKYFRLLADVYADGESIGDMLIEAKLAVPYDGGTKAKVWCN